MASNYLCPVTSSQSIDLTSEKNCQFTINLTCQQQVTKTSVVHVVKVPAPSEGLVIKLVSFACDFIFQKVCFCEYARLCI